MDLIKLAKVIRELNKEDEVVSIDIQKQEVEVKDINKYGIDPMTRNGGLTMYFYIDGVKFYSSDFKKRGMDDVYLD